MKIANIVLSSQNGGVEQVVIDYSLVLKNLGHEVMVIARTNAPYILQLEQLGIKVVKVNNYFGYGDVFAIFSIAKIIKENDLDVVFSHASKASNLASRAIKRVNKKNRQKKVCQIAVNHSNNVKRSLVADIVLSINKPIFYKTIDLGRNYTNSFIVPNAIDIDGISDNITPIIFESKKVIRIGIIGRLVKSKGFDHVIKAIKYLDEQPAVTHKFLLKIAGSGIEEENLKGLVKSLNLQDKIEFCGWVDKATFFNQIDIFCLPSLNEPFGLVVIEAMKYKVPIIATNSDGPNEIIKDQFDGLIVEIDPIESLYQKIGNAITTITTNQQLANDLVNNAFDKLKAKYSFKSLEKNLSDILKLAIPKR